ncbi:MAG: hypothetical protein MJZ37_04445 [Bacilli bacterium]|nr:hypothetical protein [Bacilli bacterium]
MNTQKLLKTQIKIWVSNGLLQQRKTHYRFDTKNIEKTHFEEFCAVVDVLKIK